MVCTANDLSAWKDFPKGLRVLLFDEDNVSASEMKSKLEDMDYVVFLFSNENDALSAISSNLESFHVAIVEVNSSNSDICFKFLEAAKNLPTIMTSSIHCLNTMMKCIALGAVEFLQKPLSDDKLRNIWQHVVHKAFNTGAPASSESLKPVKESVASILQLKSETELAEKTEELADGHISHSEENEELPPSKYPAPSTLELDHGKCPVDVTVCQDKDSGKQELGFEPTVVTCTMVELTNVNHSQSIKRTVVKEEDDSTEGVKNDSAISVDPKTKESVDNSKGITDNQSKSSGLKTSNGVKANRKKTKLDWKPELHKKFLQAVEQLGVDQAIPSRILEVMNVEGLTRHNIASHLQKYRMHHRHILPKEDDQRWTQQRNQMQRSYYPHGPVIAYPAYQSNNRLQPTPVYSLWGGNSNQHRGVPAWAPPSYLSWTPAESWHWKSYPRIHIEASGCPTMPPLHGCYPSFPQTVQYLPTLHSGGMVESGCSFNMQHSSFCQYPADEVIDKVVKEAISKPWLPLPLGLRPPSTDSVLSELYKQGICSVPPHKNGPTES